MSQEGECHRIRLVGPWEVQPLEGVAFQQQAGEGTVRRKLPQSWQDLFGEQAGKALFRRSFNKPTGLQNQPLKICLEALRATGEVRLNGQLLGQILKSKETLRFPICAELQNFNQLEIELHCQPQAERACGLWQPVLLEIYE